MGREARAGKSAMTASRRWQVGDGREPLWASRRWQGTPAGKSAMPVLTFDRTGRGVPRPPAVYNVAGGYSGNTVQRQPNSLPRDPYDCALRTPLRMTRLLSVPQGVIGLTCLDRTLHGRSSSARRGSPDGKSVMPVLTFDRTGWGVRPRPPANLAERYLAPSSGGVSRDQGGSEFERNGTVRYKYPAATARYAAVRGRTALPSSSPTKQGRE